MNRASHDPQPESLRGGQPPSRHAATEGESAAPRFRLSANILEYFESLPLAAQFRLSVVAAAGVTLLGVIVFIACWDFVAERVANRREAREVAALVAAGVARRETTQVLDLLEARPLILEAELRGADGDVLQRFDAGGVRSHGPFTGGTLPRGKKWPHPAMRFLGFEPDFVEYPVARDAGDGLTLGMVIDHRPPWAAVLARVIQAPFVLALGVLFAALAANALKRHVAEPLSQLAAATRIRQGQRQEGDAIVPDRPRGANELSEVAANFEALAVRLEQYERDMTNLRVASRQEIATRTRDLEERLRKAEAATNFKDEFLANMSHEIRTPMNGVLGMAELLAGTELDKRQRRYVDSMRSAAETMMQIINAILDDSKIEAGKMELVRDPFDVRDFAEQVGEIFAGRAETKKLELICRVEPTVPTTVVGDALRLRQVLGNLMSNAVKYTEQGEIQIRIGVDDLSGDRCRLHFSVSDTGPGIAEADQAAVFEAFTQLGHSQRVGGTGLGLSIATRLVQLMGGEKIDLWSQPGKGSSFSFVLPFAVKDAAPAPDRTSDEFAGLRVLVVDDSPTSYMQLEEMLSNWSADVAVLQHGRLLEDRLKEAAARGRPYSVVLLDHALPDATTEALLRTIRLTPALADTWVVLLSAFDYDAPYEGKRAIKPDMCLAKPVRQTLLRSALQASRQPRLPDEPEVPRAGRPESAELPLVSLGLDVLVADDNAVNREVAQAMLERLGCRVTNAEDGNAALDQVRRRRFDVIFMDCQMPEMDGYAATSAIRRTESERGMKPTTIIALTANVLGRDRARCLEAGMNRILAKPFTQEQLLGMLKPMAEERGSLVSQVAAPRSQASGSLAIADVAGMEPRDVVGAQALPDDEEPEALLSDTVVLDLLEMPSREDGAVDSAPVLDEQQVAAIRSLGKPEIFERLCSLLYSTAPASLQKLGDALEAGDLESAAAAAHSLKSPVSSLGGRRLAQQLERCETAAREHGDLSAARRAARGLKQAYADLESALRAETRLATGT